MPDIRVFVVEDEAIVAADIARKLKNCGYTVCGGTANGEEALPLVQMLGPDVVLMDISLAGEMDGVDAAEQIRRECDIPVIYLTAHSDRATLERAKRTEPFGYLLKPFEEHELEAHIEMALYKHQAEYKLRESEHRWATTLSSIGDAVITCDCKGKVTFLNPVAEVLTGWTNEEAQGLPAMHVFKIINEQTRLPAEDLVARVCHERRILGLANHTALVTLDGRVVPIEDSASPIMNAAGQMTGVVIVFHDVTEKRRAQEEQERLASFPQLNPIPIFEADLAGRVHYCNPAAERIFPDLAERGPDHPCLLEWETVADLCRAGERRLTIRETPVGDACYEQTLHFVPEIQRIRVYGTDVSERKQAEEALRRTAADLERSNKELEQFAYVASHDLQEPLRAVIGYVNLLESRLRDQLDDKSRQHIDGALQGAARMQQLISDLLALSRVGTQGKPFTDTDLNTVLEHAMQNLRATVQETGAIITHDPLPTLCVDGGQLAQLFQNLLANAIKFRDNKTPEIHIGAEQHEDGWQLSVCDNGIGIDPQNFDRIFLVFQRLHTRTHYPGTGIGLAICKKIVERHCGTIWVESQPGEGSTFYFKIPG